MVSNIKRYLVTVYYALLAGLVLSGFPEGTADTPRDLYVSLAGKDTNPGTWEKPLRTIQKAATVVTPGSTVYIRGGVYREKVVIKVSGNAQNGIITFKPYQGERVTVSGANTPAPEDTYGDNIFFLQDKDYIRIEGLELTDNLVKNDGSGIRAYGSGNHLEIVNNKIHNIRGKNAMGITIYGTDGKPIENLLIQGNEIYDCDPAKSEALTLNGNVVNFKIVGNTVHDVNNIGIDMIGGETWLSSAYVREGLCAGNVVYRARSSYGKGYAAGIYVDGARDIIIEKNIIFSCDLGVEIGAENPGAKVYNIIVRNNVIHHNDKSGLIFGGFDADRGRVQYCQFLNNTLYNNNRLVAKGEIWIQYAQDNLIQNNIIFTSASADGKTILLLCSLETGNFNNSLVNNLYYVPAGSPSDQLFQFRDNAYSSIKSYQQDTGEDATSTMQDPLFREPDADEVDLRLKAGSPAIDSGVATENCGSEDFTGAPRTKGKGLDLGAFEF